MKQAGLHPRVLIKNWEGYLPPEDPRPTPGPSRDPSQEGESARRLAVNISQNSAPRATAAGSPDVLRRALHRAPHTSLWAPEKGQQTDRQRDTLRGTELRGFRAGAGGSYHSSRVRVLVPHGPEPPQGPTSNLHPTGKHGAPRGDCWTCNANSPLPLLRPRCPRRPQPGPAGLA